MKQLDFIFNPLRSINCLCGWESVGIVVESLFIGGELSPKQQLRFRLNNRQIREIEHDNFAYANSVLLNAAPKMNKQSGRYRDKAVPI